MARDGWGVRWLPRCSMSQEKALGFGLGLGGEEHDAQ